jgi:hypothetical protein
VVPPEDEFAMDEIEFVRLAFSNSNSEIEWPDTFVVVVSPELRNKREDIREHSREETDTIKGVTHIKG